ncbi:hypothetical protein POM88_005186 [Heracleum sosnowskyi]|uniref:Uncharacterized protein n=1 Tax=Heracleum sosnowskyi TaxID=360622 RepID=A0AAD8JN14_9APIA|nr:hypothetical protein POM88_005186 [Heracleum sosnowskyi]
MIKICPEHLVQCFELPSQSDTTEKSDSVSFGKPIIDEAAYGELREPDAYFWKNNEVDCLESGNLDNGLVGTDYIVSFENNYKNGNQLCDHQHDANAEGQDGELDDNGSQTREIQKKKLSSHEETPHNGPILRNNFPFTQSQRLRCVNSGTPARGSDMNLYDNRQFSDKLSEDVNGPPLERDYQLIEMIHMIATGDPLA